jgi:hypothetical protein
MTEYDYSPEAYEKYLATQARIANWVSNTNAQAHKYTSPFVPPPSSSDSSSPPSTPYHRPRERRISSSQHVPHVARDRPSTRSKTVSPTRGPPQPSSVPLRPQPTRAMTTPQHQQQPYIYAPAPVKPTYAAAYTTVPQMQMQMQMQPAHGQHPYAKPQPQVQIPGIYYAGAPPAKPKPPRSTSATRQPPPSSNSYPYPTYANGGSHARGASVPATGYRVYDPSPSRGGARGRDVVLPAPRAGQTYVVRGAHVELSVRRPPLVSRAY